MGGEDQARRGGAAEQSGTGVSDAAELFSFFVFHVAWVFSRLRSDLSLFVVAERSRDASISPAQCMLVGDIPRSFFFGSVCPVCKHVKFRHLQRLSASAAVSSPFYFPRVALK